MHATGYLHRDINTRNIMVGEEDSSKLYLIDFGLAKGFLQQDSKHVQRTSGQKFVGTVKFSSVASHEGYGTAAAKLDQARKDDLEALAFVLVYLLKGSLPWEQGKLTNRLARRDKRASSARSSKCSRRRARSSSIPMTRWRVWLRRRSWVAPGSAACVSTARSRQNW